MTIDDLLDQSRPRITARSPRLLRDLNLLTAEAAERGHHSRFRRRTVIAAVLTVSLFGLASAAVASGHLPFAWRAATGTHCSILSADVSLAGPANWNELAYRSSTDAQRKAALQEANRFLRGYDYSKVNVQAAIAEYAQEHSREMAAIPIDEADPAPEPVGDELEQVALEYHVTTAMRSHIESLGLPFGVLQPAYDTNGEIGPDGVFRCTS